MASKCRLAVAKSPLRKAVRPLASSVAFGVLSIVRVLARRGGGGKEKLRAEKAAIVRDR